MHLPNITIASIACRHVSICRPFQCQRPRTPLPSINAKPGKVRRIANGQASGKLSNREAARLQAGQAKVANMEANAKADGKVTRAERATIQHEQNKQSRHIAHQKHDGNSR
jgi:hypothetical protein